MKKIGTEFSNQLNNRPYVYMSSRNYNSRSNVIFAKKQTACISMMYISIANYPFQFILTNSLITCGYDLNNCSWFRSSKRNQFQCRVENLIITIVFWILCSYERYEFRRNRFQDIVMFARKKLFCFREIIYDGIRYDTSQKIILFSRIIQADF